MTLSEFQALIARIYQEKDGARGHQGNLAWLREEVEELARAVSTGSRAQQEEEFADVLAWTITLANLCGVDLEQCVRKYAEGCPKCKAAPCVCAD